MNAILLSDNSSNMTGAAVAGDGDTTAMIGPAAPAVDGDPTTMIGPAAKGGVR